MQTCLEKMVVQFIFACRDLFTSFLEMVLWEGCPVMESHLNWALPSDLDKPHSKQRRLRHCQAWPVAEGQWSIGSPWQLHIPSPGERAPHPQWGTKDLCFSIPSLPEKDLTANKAILLFSQAFVYPLINNDIRSLEERRRELPIGDLICYNQPLLACRVT